MVKKLFSSTLFRLILAVVIGLVFGQYFNEKVATFTVALKHVLGQIIFFFVPLIILAFISSSISKMGTMASKLLTVALILAYLSSIGAAFMALGLGYHFIPGLSIESVAHHAREVPELKFELNFPPIMSVMSALTLSILLGLGAVWSKSARIINILADFQSIMLQLLNKVLIPILPLFIATNFAILSYEGVVIGQLPVFVNILIIVILAQLVWLVILYIIAGIVSGKNPWSVVKYYAPPYFTAVGTMSSAATLPVSLDTARKSKVLSSKSVDFAIPLLSNIHLCGSILTEVFFVMAVSQIVYGKLPTTTTMVIFILLLAMFAIGAPGVPGGTVIASLGIVVSIVGFNSQATALLLTIFALQDSFGTACNVVGDGALAMIISSVEERLDKS